MFIKHVTSKYQNTETYPIFNKVEYKTLMYVMNLTPFTAV